jgi:N-acetylglucosamine-6-phosphate deacetylase
MTLAPELPDAFDLISRLRHAGVVVSMGHTDADAATAHDAVEAGVAMQTHCWNAHRRFAPRDPGPAPVAIGNVAVGLICDRVHVADDTLRLTFAGAAGRVCVVTDAVAPAGTDWTSWDIDGVEVQVGGGRACLADGTLAGSVVTMDQSVRNLIDIGIDPEVALTAASTTPAAVMGVTDHDLRPGSGADAAILDDRFEVVETVVAGRPVR